MKLRRTPPAAQVVLASLDSVIARSAGFRLAGSEIVDVLLWVGQLRGPVVPSRLSPALGQPTNAKDPRPKPGAIALRPPDSR
jgi:hypothetical protein